MDNTAKEYTEADIRNQIRPLSENAFARFFQRIWRRWLGAWYTFSETHPKASSLLYKIFFFLLFSCGVTVWQFIVMTFLPYAFSGLNRGAAGWPGIEVGSTGQRYLIFGDNNGWGYFIAFEIAVFTAQCINFPLQRNITYRSHGNPWFQAMWYFIGWIAVSVATNAIWGICNVYLTYWKVPEVVNGLFKTFLTGGVSLVIFFFIFLVIFPDNEKIAKRAKRKYEKLTAKNAPSEKLEKARARMELWEKKSLRTKAEKEFAQARSLVNSKAMRYLTLVGTMGRRGKGAEDYAEKLSASFTDAIGAIRNKEEKETVYKALTEQAN